MEVKAFFDPNTSTLTYVAYNAETRDAIIIDPVLDIDVRSWSISTESTDRVDEFVREKSLKIHWVVDSHAHADHISGMQVLKEKYGAPTAIGTDIMIVQKTFAKTFNLTDFPTDGSQWDTVLEPDQELQAGALTLKALHTPGHTPACMSYQIGDAVFVGDALFMPDYGTGRCDFPNGSAESLYDSIKNKLYTLPQSTRVFTAHDYQPGGRELLYESTIGQHMESNIRIRANTTKSEFVSDREKSDSALKPPHLILESLQINIDAGRLPKVEENGLRYLRIPLGALG